MILSRPIGILRPAPMSSPTEDLTRLLVQINAPGSFATRRTAPCTDLRLDVKGVGRLKLPITPSTALKLCAAGLLARHGRKDQTRLDRRVRDTWERNGWPQNSGRGSWRRPAEFARERC